MHRDREIEMPSISQAGIVISHPCLSRDGSLGTEMAWQMLYPLSIILRETHSAFQVHLRAHYGSTFISNCDAGPGLQR